jgi:SAM-dependent methyltransferase
MPYEIPAALDTDSLRRQVRATYARVAQEPEGDFHFHRGLDYAVEYLGYDRETLEALPAQATARFAGVGNPFAVASPKRGATVLDHACGAGMDLLIAAKLVGPHGRAIGVDMTRAMRDSAAVAAVEAGFADRVEIRSGVFEDLPVESSSVDVVVSNGVVNLAPDKERVFSEIFRVLRPGGVLLLCDVTVAREINDAVRCNADLWAACIGGALTESAIVELATEAGLIGARAVEHYDCFANTSAEAHVSKDLHVQGASFIATKES